MTPNTPSFQHDHTVQVGGPGKYLPSKAPVYPSGAVTSGWTPFNIYPCGFHRSAVQARQTLLIKTGACFKGPHSSRQSAFAGQKSQGHVAAGKPETGALFDFTFSPPLFPPTTVHGSKSEPHAFGKLGPSCEGLTIPLIRILNSVLWIEHV